MTRVVPCCYLCGEYLDATLICELHPFEAAVDAEVYTTIEAMGTVLIAAATITREQILDVRSDLLALWRARPLTAVEHDLAVACGLALIGDAAAMARVADALNSPRPIVVVRAPALQTEAA